MPVSPGCHAWCRGGVPAAANRIRASRSFLPNCCKSRESAPGETRTPNALVRSQLLIHLSFGRRALEGYNLAGVSLARILNISEQQNYNPPPRPYAMKAMAQADAAAPVPVQAGELSFSVDVSVTWDLGNGK